VLHRNGNKIAGKVVIDDGCVKLTESSQVERFKAVVLPHLNAAYRLARWLVRDDGDAQDLVQDAYLSAFKSFARFHDGNGKAWILTIVRHACYRWLQRNKRRPEAEALDETSLDLDAANSLLDRPDNDPESWLLKDESRRLVHQALEKLPPAFREIIVLRELEGYSYSEIAGIMAIPMGTVMSRLARARALLWKYLADLSVSEES
jgi:RNA polymerase sigma-70 factor (ECF subfamily)